MEGFNEYLKKLEKSMKDVPESVIKEMGGKESGFWKFFKGINVNIIGLVASFLPGIVAVIPDGLDAVTDHWKQKYKEGFTKSADNLLDVIKSYGFIDDAGVQSLNHITKQFGAFQGPVLTACIVMIVLNYLRGLMQATMGKVMQQYNTSFSPYALDASSAVRAAFVAPEDYDKSYKALRRNGISDEDISLLFKSMYSLLDEDTLRSLYFRGEMTVDEVKKNLRQRGFTDARVDAIMKTWNLIPPVNDLITMAVREAFSPDQVRSLGLDEAFPGDVAVWAKKLGLSEEWTRMYWRMHWTLPSPNMGYEMLHRGVITEGELRDLLKALDYSPRWHDPLMAISYNVMTRVDARRLFELGILDEAQLLTKYKEMGYSPLDADLLVKWTKIEYNAEYKDLTKNEVIKQYQEGIIGEPDCLSLLSYMGYSSDRISTMIALANYQRAYAKQTALIGALKKLYIAGQYSEAEVNQELSPYNIDPRRIAEMFDTWKIERLAGITLPKKTELDDWFLNGIITDSEYVTEMQRIGYSDKNISRYVKALAIKAKGT